MALIINAKAGSRATAVVSEYRRGPPLAPRVYSLAGETMDWNREAMMAIRVVVAVVLGGLLGWERERRGQHAGIRTFGTVSVGSCMFAVISTHVTGGNNPHVIAAGVVTGIGFLGAGTILREQGRIVGLTTAGTLWAAGAVGTAVGYGMYTMALLVTAILFGLLRLDKIPGWLKGTTPAEPSPAQTGDAS